MAKVTEHAFQYDISKGEIKNLYCIYGSEKYLVKKNTDLLLKKVLGKKVSDFDYVRLNSESTLEEIFDSAEQLPIASEYRCVLVNDINLDDVSESDMKQFKAFLEDISPSTILILSMPTVIFETKKATTDKKDSKYRKLISIIEKKGITLELDPPIVYAVEKQVTSWVEKSGCTISRANVRHILELCGNDLNLLRNEVDKLTAYAGHSEITNQMIDLLVCKNSEIRIYALSDCIVKNDFRGAYNNLYQLFSQNEKPEVILSVLSSAFSDMYRVRAALESGKTIADVSEDFNYKKRDFVLKNASANSRNYSTRTLRKMLSVIMDADIKLKSTRTDPRILFETMISKLILTVREDYA